MVVHLLFDSEHNSKENGQKSIFKNKKMAVQYFVLSFPLPNINISYLLPLIHLKHLAGKLFRLYPFTARQKKKLTPNFANSTAKPLAKKKAKLAYQGSVRKSPE